MNRILNINSLLKDIAMQYIDIHSLTEAKLDDIFRIVQFLVNSNSEPYRHNRKKTQVMIYIREDISSKLSDKHVFFI